MNEEYNGWTNYETWNVKLWIESDPNSQEMVQDFEREQQHDENLYEYQKDVSLQDYVWALFEGEAKLPQLTTGPFADLLNAAWQQVDWKSIREHIDEEIEDLKETR